MYIFQYCGFELGMAQNMEILANIYVWLNVDKIFIRIFVNMHWVNRIYIYSRNCMTIPILNVPLKIYIYNVRYYEIQIFSIATQIIW